MKCTAKYSTHAKHSIQMILVHTSSFVLMVEPIYAYPTYNKDCLNSRIYLTNTQVTIQWKSWTFQQVIISWYGFWRIHNQPFPKVHHNWKLGPGEQKSIKQICICESYFVSVMVWHRFKTEPSPIPNLRSIEPLVPPKPSPCLWCPDDLPISHQIFYSMALWHGIAYCITIGLWPVDSHSEKTNNSEH